MEGTKIILSEITQIQKDKRHVTCYLSPESPTSRVKAETRKVNRDHCWGNRTIERRIAKGKIWEGATRKALIRERERDRYRRLEEGKIRVKISEKVIRNHTINYLPKTSFIYVKLVYKYTYVV